MPIDYIVGESLSFEVEVGANRTPHDAGKGQDTDFFMTAGYCYDFYADGRAKCQVPSAAPEFR